METRPSERIGQTNAVPPPTGSTDPTRDQAFRRGFVAMLPLWSGVVPFAIAFAILAKTAGFTLIETQAFSLLVFAGSVQMAAVTLVGEGAGFVAVVLTAVLLNLRYVLYGLSLRTVMEPTPRLPRPLLAFVLTDESYGLAIRAYREGRGSAAFLFGASFSLYLCFGAATLGGSVLGSLIPEPERLGLDIVFPLTFLALLVPFLRSWRPVIVALVAAGTALVLNAVVSGGVTILGATVVAAVVGALLDRSTQRP